VSCLIPCNNNGVVSLATNIIWRVCMLKSNETLRHCEVVQRQKFLLLLIKMLSRRFHVNVLSVKHAEKKLCFG
jgi:hypothetical protein